MNETLKVTLAVVMHCGAATVASGTCLTPEPPKEMSVPRELEELVGGSFACLVHGGRAEAWLVERIEKTQRLEKIRPSFLERALVATEGAQAEEFLAPGLGGVRPKLGGLPSGSGIALGAAYRAELASSGLGLDLDTAWSAKGYRKHAVQFGKLETDSLGGFVHADFGYSHFPREDFFVAPTEPSDRADYRFDERSFGASAGYRITSWLGTRFQYAFLQVAVGPGTDQRFPGIDALVDDEFAPGLTSQPNFAKWSYSIVTDTRDVAGNPHSGGLASATLSWFDDRSQSGFAFRRVELDGRYYMTLGSRSRVLAARFLSSIDAHGVDQRVPFYFWPTLGGSRTLRGFSSYRFRGDRLLHLSAEYRWEPVPAVELAVFHDVGRVARSVASAEESFERSSGGGVRFKSLNGVVVRVDFARSREGSRVIVDFGAAF